MKINTILYGLLTSLLFSSCSRENSGTVVVTDSTGLSQQLTIAIVSDIHYLDPSLLQHHAGSGLAFQNYLKYDPKLIEYSDPIFRAVMEQLKSLKPDILLIPGDLTKDGEKAGHQTMATLLKEMANAGIKTFVIPGNHDINNPNSAAYDSNSAKPTATVTAQEFISIYKAFGYDSAISRDSASLSYLCQPYPNFQILAIDDCEYYDNKSFPIVGGKIKPATLKWAVDRIKSAKDKHISIYGMMHHNLIEHYNGESVLDPGYVTDNWQENADVLIAAGLPVIFTGHYHANDITKRVTGENAVYDIETGSLITAPLPYRVIVIKNNILNVSTRYVNSISAAFPGNQDFQTFSNLFLSDHLDAFFRNILSKPPYSLPADTIEFSVPLFRNAFMAHFAGDESITPAEKEKDNELSRLSPVAGAGLTTLWTDINTPDNTAHIQLSAP